MPRTAGVSSRTAVLFMRRRPRPFTVARRSALQPITLRISLTVTVFFSLMSALQRSVEQLFNVQTALGSDFGRRRGLGQGVERGANHVVRVRGTQALGDDVGDAH